MAELKVVAELGADTVNCLFHSLNTACLVSVMVFVLAITTPASGRLLLGKTYSVIALPKVVEAVACDSGIAAMPWMARADDCVTGRFDTGKNALTSELIDMLVRMLENGLSVDLMETHVFVTLAACEGLSPNACSMTKGELDQK